MQPDAYQDMARLEADHWWFRGRRAVVRRALQDLGLPPRARILDVGAGTGGNVDLLRPFGELTVVEPDPLARELLRGKHGIDALPAELPGLEGVPDGPFDLITLFDVLEHVPHDVASLKSLGERLAPEGFIVLTVPAHPWLWSRHDLQHHHVRRYTRATLAQVVEHAGLRFKRHAWFNGLLFPPILAARRLERVVGREVANGSSLPPPPVNTLLAGLFASEAPLVARGLLPIGLSLLGVLQR